MRLVSAPSGGTVRELEASLQQFGEFILRAQLVKEKAAPYWVRWVRGFPMRPASDEPLADQVRRFCEGLERDRGCLDWQIRQAEHALRAYFVNFLQRTDRGNTCAVLLVVAGGRASDTAGLRGDGEKDCGPAGAGRVAEAVVARKSVDEEVRHGKVSLE
jgi:hypothetical protein